MVLRDVDLHSSSSIPAVPQLVWSRNEAIVVSEDFSFNTHLSLQPQAICKQRHTEHILDCWAKAKLEPRAGAKDRIPQVQQ